jgi:hypothetical protein
MTENHGPYLNDGELPYGTEYWLTPDAGSETFRDDLALRIYPPRSSFSFCAI